MAVEHVFTCTICGAEAGRLTLYAAGETMTSVPGNQLRPAIVDLANHDPGVARLVQNTPWVEQVFTEIELQAVLTAIGAGDAAALHAMDTEMVPFWCPECAASYCSRHWQTWDIMDELFFDERRGLCPKGHERRIVD